MVGAAALVMTSLVAFTAVPAQAAGPTGDETTGTAGTDLYAYAKPGEQISIAYELVRQGASGHDIDLVLMDPSGAEVWNCTISGGDPLGTECATVADVAQEGAWKLSVGDQPSQPLDDYSGATWEVNVLAGGSAVPGRVWTDQYNVSQYEVGHPEDLTYWAVGDLGFKYRIGLNGYDGIFSTIAVDSIGNAEPGTCDPLYKSVDGASRPPCGPQRLFFEEPAADLPATTPSPDGELIVAPPLPTDADLVVDDLTFTSTDDTTRAGAFTYSINPRFTGAYWLEIDTNGNGTYDDPVDRRAHLGADGSGEYSYDFDGLDGNGEPIDPCGPMNARLFFDKVGEIHLTQNDVEGRDGGVSFERLNGPNLPDATLYWDDTDLSQD